MRIKSLCYRRYRLGNAFHELKLDFHAAACYRRAIQLNPSDLRSWNDLGSAYARALVKRCLFVTLWGSYIALRLWRESVEAFHQALLLAPNGSRSVPLQNVIQVQVCGGSRVCVRQGL